MKDTQQDKELHIYTTGRDDYGEDDYHHPYEPTPYTVLDRLRESGYLTRDNTVVDYGSGKGRVDFYLSAKIGCDTIGIEYDQRIYQQAIENLETYSKKCSKKKRPKFYCVSAEEYAVEKADCFYFFNPFSVEILRSVLGRILESYYEDPRQMKLFFYYPDEEYVAELIDRKSTRLNSSHL